MGQDNERCGAKDMMGLRHLMDLVPQGLCLPAISFFRPLPKYFKWMGKRYDNDQIIYDVGAGNGHTAAKLAVNGHKAHAIDLHHRDDGLQVEIANGASYDYESGSVVMVCRPCHGIFVECVIERAWECGVKEILYVGLRKNVRDDLGPYIDDSQLVAGVFGQDGERIWIVKP